MLKMIYLVRRADGVSHEQLVAHWRDPHMPTVIEHLRPDQYRVTFFDQRDDAAFDGMAVLWYRDAARARAVQQNVAAGDVPDDGFAALTQPPHVLLECEEHVIVDGPRPEGALKLTALVRRKPGVDPDALYKNWLEEHAPNVARGLRATEGGLRYAISFATQGEADPPYAGLAEVYYADAAASRAHTAKVGPDRFGDFAEGAGFLVGREVVGIP